jgi:hypothetical protein
MIKIIQAHYVPQRILRLYFSDNSFGDYDLQPLIDRRTELVKVLNDEVYFKRFFWNLEPYVGLTAWN